MAEEPLGTHMCYSEEKTYFDFAKFYLKIYQEREELLDKYLDDLIQQKCNQKDKNRFFIADFGTADGKMIMPTFKRMIGTIRQHLGNDVEIEIVFEDQEHNNCKILSQNIKEFKKENDPILCLISATSMYNRCVRENSVDYAFSFLAVHWLSKRPCCISNGIFYLDTTDEEAALFRQQSLKDLYNFLVLRHQELKPGGIMFVCCPAKPKDGAIFQSSKFNFGANFTNTLKTMMEKELITKEEFLQVNILLWPRTPQDFEEVFDRCRNEKIKFSTEGFKLSLQESVPALVGTDLQDQQKTAQQRQDTLGIIKTIMYHSICEGLADYRSAQDKSNISDAFFDIFMDKVPIEDCKFTFYLAEFFVLKNV